MIDCQNNKHRKGILKKFPLGLITLILPIILFQEITFSKLVFPQQFIARAQSCTSSFTDCMGGDKCCPDGYCSSNWNCGGSCFPTNTKIDMGNGTQKNIEDVKVGDKVISQSWSKTDTVGQKSISTVTALDQPIREHMCQINYSNGEKLKLTDEHPIYTKEGWKSINPNNSKKEVPNLNVTKLKKGDEVIKNDGSSAKVESFSCWSQKIQTYNLILDGGVNTYFANGFLAHNKNEKPWWECPPGTTYTIEQPLRMLQKCSDPIVCQTYCYSCFPKGTSIKTSDGSLKNIEDIKIGDSVISQKWSDEKALDERVTSKVIDIEKPVRDHMCRIAFNDGSDILVTDEHPLYSNKGWGAINLKIANIESPNLNIKQLQEGDFLLKEDNNYRKIELISCWSEEIQTYNLKLDGDVNTYFAEDVLVHNKKRGCWEECWEVPIRCTYCMHLFGCVQLQGHLAGSEGLCSGTKMVCYAVNCVPNNPTPSPIPSPSCTVSLTPVNGTVTENNTLLYTATVDIQNGTVEKVLFKSNDTSIATFDPAEDFVSPYSSTITGVEEGSTTIKAEVFSSGSVRCSTTTGLNVEQGNYAWWQTKDGDITTNGEVVSDMPLGNVLIKDGLGGFPGVVSYGTSLDINENQPSSKNWGVNSQIQLSRLYDYSYFANLVPDDVELLNPSADSLESGGTDYYGYYWYKNDGDLNLDSDINLGDRKVILFVENGNLNINGKINLNDGTGFFMAISDQNISIDSDVSGSPSLEGLYVADGIFSTGNGNQQLHIRGSVAAHSGINMERDLETNNEPAEYFEYAPDQVLLFPQKLAGYKTRWNEIAP